MKKQLDKYFYKVIIYLTDNIITEYVIDEKEEKDVVAFYKWMEEYYDFDELVDNYNFVLLTNFVKYEVDKTLISKNDIDNYKPYYTAFDWRNFIDDYGEDGSRFPSVETMKGSNISHEEYFKQLKMKDIETYRRTDYIQMIEKQPQYNHSRLFSKYSTHYDTDEDEENCKNNVVKYPKEYCLNNKEDECYSITGIS